MQQLTFFQTQNRQHVQRIADPLPIQMLIWNQEYLKELGSAFTAPTASAFQRVLYTKYWNISVWSGFHSARRASVRAGMDDGWLVLDYNRHSNSFCHSRKHSFASPQPSAQCYQASALYPSSWCLELSTEALGSCMTAPAFPFYQHCISMDIIHTVWWLNTYCVVTYIVVTGYFEPVVYVVLFWQYQVVLQNSKRKKCFTHTRWRSSNIMHFIGRKWNRTSTQQINSSFKLRGAILKHIMLRLPSVSSIIAGSQVQFITTPKVFVPWSPREHNCMCFLWVSRLPSFSHHDSCQPGSPTSSNVFVTARKACT